MSYETGLDDDELIIDFDNKTIKGYTTKKNLKKQMEKLKEVME